MTAPRSSGVSRFPAVGLLALCALQLAGCMEARPEVDDPLTVFAASDLQPVLPAIAELFLEAGGPPLRLVFGSSGNLATQIAHGAPADVYLAASAAFVDASIAAGHALRESRTPYAVGRLALIVRTGVPAPRDVPDLGSPVYRVISIANPAHAPYGVAAREALASAGLGAAVEPRLVLADNVVQAYQLVSTGSADAGLVALSLVLARPGGSEILVDPELHAPILQVGAVVTGSRRPEAAAAFLRFLTRAEAQEILARYGFETPES